MTEDQVATDPVHEVRVVDGDNGEAAVAVRVVDVFEEHSGHGYDVRTTCGRDGEISLLSVSEEFCVLENIYNAL